MSQKSQNIVQRQPLKPVQPQQDKSQDIDPQKSRKRPQIKHKPIKKKRKMLSFEDEQQEQSSPIRVRKNVQIKKQTNKEDKQENTEQKLKEQFLKQSQRLKEELIQFEYSYWDGANVIKKLRRKKKQTIRQLLQVCRLELIQNVQSLAQMNASDLLLIIKDFMAPLDISLVDIETLALKTSKKDLLLNLRNVKIKKDGKDLTLSVNLDGPFRIIEKARYEKNKASFPFCNWSTLNLKSK